MWSLISKENINRAAASPPTASAQRVYPEADKTVKQEAQCGDILLESRGQQTDNKMWRRASEGGQSGGKGKEMQCYSGDLTGNTRQITCWFLFCL